MSTTASTGPTSRDRGPLASLRAQAAVYGLPRSLHPGAWWLWALGCAVASSRTTNPLSLALLVAVVALVVVLRRSEAPWAMAFRLYLGLAGFIIVVRVGFRILFGANGSTVLFDLPRIQLPDPFSITLFGPVSAEAVLSGLYGGCQLGAMVICVGAANALANPKRLLAAVPGALYEFGAVLVVALSVFPQLAESVQRVARARRLRSGQGRRHFLRQVMMPVLADALDRSLDLAGAMDSRGYGQRGTVTARARHLTSGLLLLAAGGLCVGAYAALDTSGATPGWLGGAALGGGLLLAGVALRVAGRRARRTRYRPDRWRAAEVVVVLCGLAPALALSWLSRVHPTLAYPSVSPLVWPGLAPVELVGLLVAALPAWLTPPPPDRAVAASHSDQEAKTA
ncbi:MAG: energy-coupling factor transporter transmembrane protein EcfT [Propionibacteriaceae bacterium]|nr:energy-coupling factor transporter transmembrane protein EcfT [Propionibacteriaceae bacterium]